MDRFLQTYRNYVCTIQLRSRMNYRNIMFQYFCSRKDLMVHLYSRNNISYAFWLNRARCESGCIERERVKWRVQSGINAA